MPQTFSREFGGGLLPKWGFLIISHFHCFISVLNFPLPLIQTYDTISLVDQVMALLNMLLLWLTKWQSFPMDSVLVDQVTTLLNKDLHYHPSFLPSPQSGFPSSLVSNLQVSFISWPTDYAAWAISSSHSTRFGWPTQRGLFFCTLSREFGRGSLPRWGFLIIIVSYLF